MRLLFISTKKTWGGSEPLWCNAAQKSLQEGHEVVCVLPETKELHTRHKELIAQGAELILRPLRLMPTLGNRLMWKIAGNKMPETNWWHHRFPAKFDAICLSQGGTYCALSMPGLIPWLLECGVPYLIVCHSHRNYALPDISSRQELRNFILKANKICFDAFVHAGHAERFLGVGLNNKAEVQNPINIRGTDPEPWPKGKDFRMACVARLEIRDKGQDLLLEALADPVWKDRDFRLDFYGGGPDREILEDLIALYGLGEKVRIAGFESDIRKIWADHEMLVLPSVSEGTPISLIEAQICGRAALVTRVDGNPEWVEEGRTGFLAEAPIVYHLRLALERAWENRHRWRKMGEAAREACLAKWDPNPAGTLLRLLKAAAEA
jgi:glycosyltransferase involved in cell wall biosynthesis